MSTRKSELLRRLPVGMRKAHRNQTVRFIRESISAWDDADDGARADIMAFFTSDGPAKVARVLVELEAI